jgi:hypothetical protein
VARVVRTLSIIEQRAESLEIHRARLRQPKAGDLPTQINIQNNVGVSAPVDSGVDVPQRDINEIVDEILSRGAVQSALDADLPSTEDYGM